MTENEFKKFAWPVFILSLILILGTGLTGCETLHSAVEIVRENICN